MHRATTRDADGIIAGERDGVRPAVELAGRAALSTLIAGCTVALIAATADRGLDFTDEGFYLNWIARPFLYEGSRTQFGFIYHPVFEAFGGDIASLRRFNVAAIFLLALGFCSLVVRTSYPQLRSRPFVWLGFSTGIAVSAFGQLHWLPLTPNYNWLNVTGILLGLTGAALAPNKARLAPVACGLLLGAGMWLSGMAKPPTAVVLGLLLLPYVFIVGERPVILAAVAIAGAGILSLLTALAIDGSVPGFLARLALGQEIGAQLNAGYTPDQLLKRLDSLFVTSSDAAAFWAIFVAAALLAWLSLRDARWAVVGRWLMIAAAAAATLLMLAGFRPVQIEQSLMQEIWLAAAPAGIVTVALACRDKVSRVFGAKFGTKSAISLVVALLLTPAAYAIGTGNNQWFQAAHLLIAWMAAAVVVPAVTCAPEKAERILSALALASAAVAGVLVSIGIEQPYRSAHGLRDQTAAAEVGSDGARLRLSPESADYIRNIRQAAYGSGFTEGTPVLDLTGRHPATVFVIGGSAPGTAWLISGFPGSREYVRAALRRVPCHVLARAWLLTPIESAQPQPARSPLMTLKLGPNATLPADTLAPFGLDRHSGYRQVFEAPSPVGYGFHALLAPTAESATRQRCDELRESQRTGLNVRLSPVPVSG